VVAAVVIVWAGTWSAKVASAVVRRSVNFIVLLPGKQDS
jgi:hypothetical protein